MQQSDAAQATLTALCNTPSMGNVICMFTYSLCVTINTYTVICLLHVRLSIILSNFSYFFYVVTVGHVAQHEA